MPLKFTRVLIADERYETAGVFDVNNDGHLDIVSGAYWYEGPDFKKKHRVGDVQAVGEWFDDFSTIPMDVNGDGWMDFMTGGWWSKTLRWRENPGPRGGEWLEHVIAECGNLETAQAWDVDGDGQLEIVPNTPRGPVRFYKLITDSSGKGTGQFSEHVLHKGPQGHGLGFGDINGDGRGDFVMQKGWLEASADASNGWIFHPDFNLGSASIPIIVADVNGDGLNDLIVGQAHDYGLDWWEQGRDGVGDRTWTKHPIDPYNAGFHALQWVDIDGDGECELVAGKRYRAHAGNDPGESDDYGLYYYKWTGESFCKQVIDYAPIGYGTGCGVFFAIADLRGTGRLDIVAPGKAGLWAFFNEGT
jgi:hypothetical protein